MESHLGDASLAETDRGNFRFKDQSENHTVWLTEFKDIVLNFKEKTQLKVLGVV